MIPPHPPPWPAKRRQILADLGHLPQRLRSGSCAGRSISDLLVAEGLVCDAGDGLHQITTAGKVLRAMHQLAADESGPWGTTDLRRARPVKQLDMTVLRGALDELEARGLVATASTKRTPKWDLTTK